MAQEIKKPILPILSMIQVMDELVIAHKKYFESSMANMILKNRSSVPAVDTVSEKILYYIEKSKERIVDIIKNDPSIKENLYGDYMFGRLSYQDNMDESPEAILSQIIDILNNKSSNLSCVIHIHAAFIHKIYSKLLNQHSDDANEAEQRALKDSLVKKIFLPSLFNERGRIEKEQNRDLIKKRNFNGITAHRFFAQKMPPTQSHRKAMDIFYPEHHSTFFRKTAQYKIPFIAGASGHTGSLMLGAALYGNLDDEGLREYAMATFAYLTSGGNHSFHEVMIVANTLGIPYDPESYICSLPKNFLNSEIFQTLQGQFDQFLTAEQSQPPLQCR